MFVKSLTERVGDVELTRILIARLQKMREDNFREAIAAPKFMRDVDALLSIWIAMAEAHAKACLTRTGPIKVGADETLRGGPGEVERVMREAALRPHLTTVGEHTHICILLIQFVNMYWPEVIPDDELKAMTILANAHDNGEIYFGDIADDGSSAHESEERVRRESAAVIRSVLSMNLPTAVTRQAIEMQQEFEEKRTIRGRTMFSIDKIQGVVGALLLENQGYHGSLEYKRQLVGELSARERRAIRATRSVRMSDIWAYCSLFMDEPVGEIEGPQRMALLHGLKEHFDLFWNLINIGHIAVYGSGFTWARWIAVSDGELLRAPAHCWTPNWWYDWDKMDATLSKKEMIL